MYKLLLADDESDIREGLMEVVHFEEHGFTVVGQAENGLEALRLCEEQEPDLIVSDIRMPLMDGLTMLAEAEKALPTVRSIILSGYDEFEFARQAVSLHCLGYLLKPISAAEFTEALTDARKKLDEDFARRRDMLQLQRHFEEGLPVFRATLLTALLDGGLPVSRTLEMAERYGLPLNENDLYAVALLRLSQPKGEGFPSGEPELLRVAAMDIVREQLPKESGYAFFYQSYIAVLLWLPGEEAAAQTYERLDGVCRHIDHYLGRGTVRAGIGNPCRGAGGLSECARQAKSALAQRSFYENRLLLFSDLAPGGAGELSADAALLRELDTALKKGSAGEARRWIEQLLSVCRTARPGTSAYRSYLLEIYVALLRTGRDMSVTLAESGEEPLDRLLALPPAEEACRLFYRLCDDFTEKTASNRLTAGQQIIQAAQTYIKGHYADPELTAEKLCRHLHVSSSYFSALFKRETGRNFPNYLTETRMRQAMTLLAGTDMKTASIAEAVGVPDPSYFSYVFKRVYGLSPSQVRRRREGGA
ncbi:MAG: response regulator [Lachnospiraceae bacterium]